jgi:hypothetical protein
MTNRTTRTRPRNLRSFFIPALLVFLTLRNEKERFSLRGLRSK